MKVIELPSPNHAARQSAVDVLVLHYTEMPLDESLKILRDGRRPNRVSAHYVLAEDGTVYRLVPEDRVAWHAGASSWRGREALNGTSIGIEIVNLHGDRHDYPDVQIAALMELCRDIIGRHPAIEPRNVRRKVDPGLRFPWAKLAANGIGLWPRRGAKPIEGDVQLALQRFGYPPAVDVTTDDVVASFQRRYRPGRVDGVADDETRALLTDLLDQVGNRA